MAFLKDRDNRWYQTLSPQRLGPGTNRWEFNLSPGAEGWESYGHHGAWHHRLRIDPSAVGLRLFSYDAAYTGVCSFAQASA